MDARLRKTISEEVLRHAVIACFEREMSALPTDDELLNLDLDVSERHKKRMKKLFRNDMLKEIRKRIYNISRQAAVIVLILTSALFLILLTNVKVRAAISQVIVKWYEEFTQFSSIYDNAPDKLLEWYPSYLPDGFILEDEKKLATTATVEFINQDGVFIDIIYSPISSGTAFNIDNEHSNFEIIIKEDIEYSVFHSTFPEYVSSVVWQSDRYEFAIQSTISVDELLLIASSMK